MIKVAIVGTGYIAQYHYQALKLIPNIEITSVCDSHLPSAERFAKNAGIPNVYGSIDTLLQQQVLNTVHICTPAPSHVALARAVVSAGARVFVEKPISIDIVGAEEMVALAQKGARIATNHNFLFLPVL